LQIEGHRKKDDAEEQENQNRHDQRKLDDGLSLLGVPPTGSSVSNWL
jgi:hypothetical protein